MDLSQQEINALKGEAARRDLKRFIREFWFVVEPTTPFQEGYHVDAICDHLVHIRDIRNLIINMPPRMGKSTMICVLWFCWYWASSPSTRFIFSSYASQLSIRDSIRCRQLIESDLYQSYFGQVFSINEDTKAKFSNSKTGYRLAVSNEGSTTGEGGEVIVADDPHNLQEADSKASRDSVIRWFNTVFTNRLNDPATGCRLLVMQRCHVEDLSGWLLKNDIENRWTKLILPLEAGKSRWVSTRWKDARLPGELLSPARIPPAEVSFLKQSLGKRAFDSQYNQNPSPAEDQIFDVEDIRYYDELPEGGMRIAAVDLAISTKGDYTVIAIADVFPDGTIFLLHVHRERMAGPQIVPTIKMLHSIHRPQIIYVEDVAFQRIIIQECRAQGLPVKPVRPEGDKVTRSIMLQVKMENHQFYMPKEKSWTADVIEELAEFPNAAHDDIVDALSYIAIQGNVLHRRIPEKVQQETPEDRNKRLNEEFNKAVKEDEERWRTAFFQGI